MITSIFLAVVCQLWVLSTVSLVNNNADKANAFHMQRGCICMDAFCFVMFTKKASHFLINQKTGRQSYSNPHVSRTQHAADDVTEPWCFCKVLQIYSVGKMYKKHNCALIWVLEGGEFAFRGRVERGECVSTNYWPTEVGFGSWVRLLWNRLLFIPLEGVFFFHIISWMYETLDMVTKQFSFPGC